MKYWFLLLPLGLPSCLSETSKETSDLCSSIETVDKQTIVNNAFYKVLENGSVLSILEQQILDDSLGFNHVQVSSIEEKWQIDLHQLDYQMQQNLLIAEWRENDIHDASYSAFSLHTGEKLLDYTYDKLEILFNQPEEKRFFGFYSDNGIAIDAYTENRAKGTLGVLTYANQANPIRQLRLSAADPMWEALLDISNPVFELIPLTPGTLVLNNGKSLFFTSQDASEDSEVNFDIRIIFYTTDTYKPVEFTLQVRNDELLLPKDFQHSVFTLESL